MLAGTFCCYKFTFLSIGFAAFNPNYAFENMKLFLPLFFTFF